MSIHAKLSELQYKLVAPKGQYNSFGKYRYRNCEDILEAVKPLLHELKCTLTLSDDVVAIGEPVILTSHTRKEELDKDKMPKLVDYTESQKCNQRFYFKATATLTDIETGESVSTTAFAREEEAKKGMDESQISGSCSSYSRKYCLCALLCIDDNKDSDTTNTQTKEEKKAEPVKISADIYTEFMRGKNLFEQYVNKGLIKQESLDKLVKEEAVAKTDAEYQRLINKMTVNINEAKELEKK